MTDFGALLDEYESEILEKTRREIAAEDAAWAALPQAEKDRISALREAKIAAMDGAVEEEEEGEDEEEEE